MSLIVETGTASATSESYASVDFALAYHAARGNDTWATITTLQQEQALRRATDYMTQNYCSRWSGIRVSQYQALDWPRYGVTAFGYPVIQTTIPNEIKNACAELALKAAAGELLADQDIAVVREKLGPIETEYDKNASQRKKYPAIDAMLAPYLSGSSNSATLVRV